MTPLPYRNLTDVTRYQDLVSFARRFDRDRLLIRLSRAGSTWDGQSVDERGRMHPFLPWNVSGAAATVITRGTIGGRVPEFDDLRRLCFLFFNLEHPGTPGEPEFALQLLGRLLYQQWPYLRLDLKEWARPVALFELTDFDATYQPEVMGNDWAEQVLGCSVAEFISTGFTLYAAARTGGRHPLIWDEGLQELVEMYGGRERFDAIVESNFVTDIEQFKLSRRDYVERLALTYKQEPFSFNPLHATPFVRGVIDGEALAPSPASIQIRSSAVGILYAGLAKWSTAFSRDIGHRFEQYIGKNLRLLEGVEIHPEVSYRTSQGPKHSIDWFVVTPGAVLLVECKSLVPTADVREGYGPVTAHERLEKALRQINATVEALETSRPEFQHIPRDRPAIGLIVTFENFELANDSEIRSTLPLASIPTAIVGVDVIEDLATWTPETMQAQVVSAARHTDGINILEPRGWLQGAQRRENPLILEAFERLPAISLLGQRRPELFQPEP